jgi:hypothetical protein
LDHLDRCAGLRQEDKRNIAEVECKAVMRLNDRERENTIVFLHGYLAGKKGELVIDLAKLSAATRQVHLPLP